MKVVLASQSKFRIQILQQIGIKFTAMAAKTDEKEFTGSSPKETAELRSAQKALSLVTLHPENTIIIGCDQTLEFEAQHFDKAKSLDEARERLLAFQGKTHLLHSSTTLLTNSASKAVQNTFTETCEMQMRKLTTQQIDNYLTFNEWQGCVGCYQFENVGANLFEKVDGDTQSIVGLPVLRLLSELRKLGCQPI